jgi:hypothetical protein
MRALVWVFAACSGGSRPASEPAASPHDAAIAVAATDAPAVDALPPPVLSCTSGTHRLMGKVHVAVDAVTMRGELTMYDASALPSRHLIVHAEQSAQATVLLFDGYGRDDSMFKGKPVPRRDHFAKGAPIARIAAEHDGPRLVLDDALGLGSAFDNGAWRDGYRCGRGS